MQRFKKFALPMQKIKKACIANAKNKKKLAVPMQKIKINCIPNAKNKKSVTLKFRKFQWSMKIDLSQQWLYLVYYQGPIDCIYGTVFAVKILVPENRLDAWSRLIDFTPHFHSLLRSPDLYLKVCYSKTSWDTVKLAKNIPCISKPCILVLLQDPINNRVTAR